MPLPPDPIDLQLPAQPSPSLDPLLRLELQRIYYALETLRRAIEKLRADIP